MKRYCEICGDFVDRTENFYAEGAEDQDVICESCGDEHLIFHEHVQAFVHEAEYSEVLYDDELSDITLYRFFYGFTAEEVNALDNFIRRVQEEPNAVFFMMTPGEEEEEDAFSEVNPDEFIEWLKERGK